MRDSARGLALFLPLSFLLLVLRLDGSQVTHWGSVEWVDTNAVSRITNLVSVAAAGAHVLACDRQGKVFGWGDNVHGQSDVPANLESVVALAAGPYHSLGLKSDGTLVAWGRMSDGWSMQPASVPSGLSNVISIACGFAHSVALRANGTVTAWHGGGVLTLPSHWTNIISIGAEGSGVAAVKADGTAVFYDRNSGEIALSGWTNMVQVAPASLLVGLRGDGTLLSHGSDAYDPQGALSRMSNVLLLSGAGDHGCVLFGNGTVTNWGFLPTQAAIPPPGLSNISAVASGWGFDVALEGEGAPWIVEHPASRTILGGSVTQLRVRATGELPLKYEWRFNGSSLENETNAVLILGAATPVREGTYDVVVRNAQGAVTSRVVQVSVPAAFIRVQPESLVTYPGASPSLTAEVTANGPYGVQWQFNGIDLPNGTNLTLTLSSIRRDQAGVYRARATNAYGLSMSLPVVVGVSSVAAWGQDTQGETRVPADLGDVVGIAAGGWHGLALTRQGYVRAWGSQAEFSEPKAVSNMVAIAAGSSHSLALGADGLVAGWGGGVFGEGSVPSGLSNVVAVAASIYNSLALRADGTVSVWGNNSLGQTYIPAQITNVVGIASGLYGGMALKADGTVDTWGSGDFGFGAVPPDLSNVVAIACGRAHTLALKADGTVVAWGSSAELPPGLTNVVAISAASENNLALKGDGTAVAWGTFNGWVSQPSFVPSGLEKVTGISAGSTFNLAIVGEGPPFVSMARTSRHLLGGRSATFYGQATGAWPLSYQWQHAGTNLPGATGPSLLVTNLQPADAGAYSLVVSNEYGIGTSGECTLEVVPCGVSLQATNLVTFPGGRAFLVGVVSGNEADSYQWQVEGEDIPWARGVSLTLTNVQYADAGKYTVVVSNRYGTVRSAPCSLSVVPIASWGMSDQSVLNVPASLSNVVKVAAGTDFSVALRSDGKARYWGRTGPSSLTNIPPDATNLVALAAGTSHVLSLRGDGTVCGWGVQSYSPVTIPPEVTNVISIAAGADHNLAARADGSVVGWGTTSYGVTKIPSTLTNAVAVAAGRYHSMALRSDGTVTCWGSSNRGQTNVPAGLDQVVAIAAAQDCSLALKADGTVSAWGYINNQRAGVPEGLSGVVGIACGPLHCYALRGDGSLVGWGAGAGEQTNTPPEVAGVSDVACGYSHTLALIGGGPPQVLQSPVRSFTVRDGRSLMLSIAPTGAQPMAYQWQVNGTNVPGANSPFLALKNIHPTQSGLYSVLISNAFGNIVVTNASVVVDSLRFTQSPTNIVARIADTVLFAGAAEGFPPLSYQWQFNGVDIPGATTNVLVFTNVSFSSAGSYQLRASNPYAVLPGRIVSLTVVPVVAWGNNSSGQTEIPLAASNTVAIAAGREFSLALKEDGTVVAWGDSAFGQCAVPGGLSNVITIAAGAQHGLALRSDKTIVAWGRNLEQQCNVPSGLTRVVAIAAGTAHSLALKEDGSVVAWGGNANGQTNVPTSLKAVAIACGENHCLALREDGLVAAWGAQTYGQTDVPANLTNAIAIGAGLAHSVAAVADGSLIAWGNNYNWQLNVPKDAGGVCRLAVGALHNLGITRDRRIITWGWNLNGQTNVPPDLPPCVAVAAGGGHSLALLAEVPGPIQSLPLGLSFTEGHFGFTYPTEPGRVYRVEFVDTLNAPQSQWGALPLQPGTGNRLGFIEPDVPSGPKRFYRLRQW